MKAKQKRPWSLQTANSIAEQVNKTSESDNRSQELNQLNAIMSYHMMLDRDR